eukprot:scaffold34610_cov50-Attheya_sp.AAC.4
MALLATPEEDDDAGDVVVTAKDIRDEANEALASVGWARPMDDGDMTSDDPFVRRIDAEIQKDVGVSLDELLNPAKVVNLERDLYNLRAELASLTGQVMEDDNTFSSTEECDGGGGGEQADAIRATITKKETSLTTERRAVFRGCEQPIKVLGFWWWWLFIVPSLRSRRPGGTEQKALDIAFLGTPLISLIAPVATKDTSEIWLANLAVVVAAYGFAFAFANDDEDDDEEGSKGPAWLKFIYKSLDFGSGRERGARN